MKTESFKRALSPALAITLLIVSVVLLLSPSSVHAALTPHSPILIVGNDNFTPANGVTSGSGTKNAPYIIENWDIDASSTDGIFILNTTAYFVIKNCYVHDGQDKANSGILLYNAVNGKIENNIVENNSGGIFLAGSDNNLISNNVVDNSYNSNSIYLSGYSDNNLISNNVVKNSLRGIFLYGHSSNNVIDNNFSENNWLGIYLYWYSDNNFILNNIVANNPNYGIALGQSSRNTIVNNLVENTLNSNYGGIYLYENSDNNIISNNTVKMNFSGIYLLASPDNNLISSNMVENNFYGIHLYLSLNNTIDNNIVENNSIGFYLEDPENNHIYHNNLINNATQASDTGTNYWDNGYPSGGNCWSDYTGVDSYHGENQNILGSDGIGDTPYSIPGGSNLDHYPLIVGIRGVQVVITPPIQENDNGGTLKYDVLVKNLGNVLENFQLTRGDNAGWTLALDNNWLLVPANDNRSTKLTVNIPANAMLGTWDNIWVKAASKDNENVWDNESCLAHVSRVQVVITPPSQENDNGGMLAYTITIKNLGNVQENFQLENGDNAGWTLSLDNTWLLVPNGESRTTRLTVNIPSNATGCTWDNIWVKAASKDNAAVFDNKSCLAHVVITRRVQVVINPSPPAYLENENGRQVTFNITVNNTGNVQENFQLTKGDNAGWTLSLDNAWLLVPNGDNRTTKLAVNIPANAVGGTWDNIWVKAASKDNENVWDNESCLSHVVIVRGVQVVINPSPPGYLENENGRQVVFTVTVNDTGNVLENFQLTRGDNAGWTLSLDNAWLLVPNGDNRTTKLAVNIPANAVGGTLDNIWVKATSKDNENVWDNESCLAHVVIVRGVQVVITPPTQDNDNGGTLKYDVLVKNLGNVLENFQLTRGDNAGWTLSLDNAWLLVPNGDNRTTKLTVNIPANAMLGTWDNIWVKATSKDNAAVFDNESCLAHVARVQVVITPSSQENVNGGMLAYTVMVKNLGNVQENYILTRGDNASWGLENLVLDNYWLLVPNGDNRTTKLTVTIPTSATGCTWDKIWVKATENDNAAVFDNESCLAHVKIVRGVSVSISPSGNSGANGALLNYTVTVNNTGNVPDTYDLTLGDNAGWSPSVLPTSLSVAASSSGNATLSVTVPTGLVAGTSDNMWVQAISENDAGVLDNKSCKATVAIVRSVGVSISPSDNSGANGATLTYTVRVSNTGNVSDNYKLENTDNSGWVKLLTNTSLVVAAFSSDNTTRENVTIPSSAIGGTIDNIKVKATSQTDNTISAENKCTAQVTIARSVSVSISPSSQSGANSATLTYTVTINNTGNVSDNYKLENTDNSGWVKLLTNTSLVVAAFSSDNTTRENVTIPSSAIGGTIDNIKVTATGTGDNSSANCTAQVTTVRGVQVLISPSSQENDNGGMLAYTVTVKNLGNVQENFQLTKGDNAGWTLSLDNTWLLVSKGENRTTKLTVSIPANAVSGTLDNIWVKAASKDNAAVFDNKSCVAHCMGVTRPSVEVSISPSSSSGTPGTMLTYTVTVKNTGGGTDNFDLNVSGGAGWSPGISPSLLTLAAGTSGTAKLTVTVPSNAVEGASTTITVKAISRADPSVSGSASCTATAKAGGISPLVYVVVVVVIVVIIVAVLVIKLFLLSPRGGSLLSEGTRSAPRGRGRIILNNQSH